MNFCEMAIFDNRLALRPDTPPRHINGITCDAQGCIYHDGDNYCTADRVNIGNIVARTSVETRCATFEPKSGIAPRE